MDENVGSSPTGRSLFFGGIMPDRATLMQNLIVGRSGCSTVKLEETFCSSFDSNVEFFSYPVRAKKRGNVSLASISGITSNIELKQPSMVLIPNEKQSITNCLLIYKSTEKDKKIFILHLVTKNQYIVQAVNLVGKLHLIARTFPELDFLIPQNDLVLLGKIFSKNEKALNQLVQGLQLLVTLKDNSCFIDSAFAGKYSTNAPEINIDREVMLKIFPNCGLTHEKFAIFSAQADQLNVKKQTNLIESHYQMPLMIKIVSSTIESFIVCSEKDEKNLDLSRFKNNDTIIR